MEPSSIGAPTGPGTADSPGRPATDTELARWAGRARGMFVYWRQPARRRTCRSTPLFPVLTEYSARILGP